MFPLYRGDAYKSPAAGHCARLAVNALPAVPFLTPAPAGVTRAIP
jgi:hypothetical protein